MAADVLREAPPGAPALQAVVVTAGPGGFTGIRAALALAHGIALARGIPIVGVTVAEAFVAAEPARPGEDVWVAIDNRRGGVFLDRGVGFAAADPERIPLPQMPLLVLGDAADRVAAALQARGAQTRLGSARWPVAEGIARAGLDRLAGRLPPRAAQPLYVDAPAVKLPPGGIRPPPRP